MIALLAAIAVCAAGLILAVAALDHAADRHYQRLQAALEHQARVLDLKARRVDLDAAPFDQDAHQ